MTSADRLYGFIVRFIGDHGYSPSVDEMGVAMGWTSKSTTWSHLWTLRDHGRVEWLQGQPRTVRPMSERRDREARRAKATS